MFEIFAICVILVQSALFVFHLIKAHGERQALIRQLFAKDQDMLDRLMGKDLADVKQAQRPPVAGITTSKRRNDLLVK